MLLSHNSKTVAELSAVKTKTESKPHSVRFYMTFWNGTTTFAEYKTFKVSFRHK